MLRAGLSQLQLGLEPGSLLRSSPLLRGREGVCPAGLEGEAVGRRRRRKEPALPSSQIGEEQGPPRRGEVGAPCIPGLVLRLTLIWYMLSASARLRLAMSSYCAFTSAMIPSRSRLRLLSMERTTEVSEI